MSDPVKAPRTVVDQILTIRKAGFCNMLDLECVMHVANREGFFDAARWISENTIEYGMAVFNGFDDDEREWRTDG
jgi:hypothetical protein